MIFFQIVNHVIHWSGDWHSGGIWNSADKVNGVSRFSAGASILSKLDAAIEKLDLVIKDDRIERAAQDKKAADDFQAEFVRCAANLGSIASDVNGFSIFAVFYFLGWYLILPTGFGLMALFWPSAILS